MRSLAKLSGTSHVGSRFRRGVTARDVEHLQKVGRVLGSVAVPKRNRDIADLLVRKQTFDEALESSETLTMTKRRLKILRNELFAQLDRLPMGMGKEKAA